MTDENALQAIFLGRLALTHLTMAAGLAWGVGTGNLYGSTEWTPR